MNYYKRLWEESTGEALTDTWGHSVYYLEVDEASNVLRQMQAFKNGKILKYSRNFSHDDFGSIANEPLENELEEFVAFKISKEDFEVLWKQVRPQYPHQAMVAFLEII